MTAGCAVLNVFSSCSLLRNGTKEHTIHTPYLAGHSLGAIGAPRAATKHAAPGRARRARGGDRGPTSRDKTCSIWPSHPVPDGSTTQTRPSLTSLFGWEAVTLGDVAACDELCMSLDTYRSAPRSFQNAVSAVHGPNAPPPRVRLSAWRLSRPRSHGHGHVCRNPPVKSSRTHTATAATPISTLGSIAFDNARRPSTHPPTHPSSSTHSRTTCTNRPPCNLPSTRCAWLVTTPRATSSQSNSSGGRSPTRTCSST